MWVQLLDVNGNKLLGENGKLVSNLHSGSYNLVYYVCVDSSNNLVIGYQYKKAGNFVAVIFKLDQSGKNLWGNKGITLGNGAAPYVATLSTGETVVAWAANDDTLKMQKISNDGKMAWATPVQLKVGKSALTQGQLVPNLNGEFTAIMQQRGFTSYSILYAMRYNNNGKPLWKKPVQLNNSSTQTYFTFPVLGENDTTYISYFYIASFPEIKTSFLQRINPDGSLPYGINGSYFSLDTLSANQDYMSICTRSDLPYIWGVCSLSDLNQDMHGISVQRFLKSNGKRLSGDSARIIYALKTGGEIPILSGAITNGNNLLFTHYDTTYRIAATRLTSNKYLRWLKRTTILSATTATYDKPKGNFIFSHNNGQGVLLWAEKRDTGYSIYAQNIVDKKNTDNDDDLDKSLSPTNNKTGLSTTAISVFPNPVKNVTNIKITAQKNYAAMLSISSTSGRVCTVKHITINKGETNQLLNVSSLQPGIYFIKLVSDDGKLITEKTFIK